MAEKADELFFECPGCGQSMAIDAKAEGLVVSCPKCEIKVRVPRRPGTEAKTPPLSQQTPEPQPISAPPQDEPSMPGDVDADQIRVLLESLASSQSRIQQLNERYNETQRRRAFLERMRAEHLGLFNEIHEQLETIKNSYDRLVEIMEDAP